MLPDVCWKRTKAEKKRCVGAFTCERERRERRKRREIARLDLWRERYERVDAD